MNDERLSLLARFKRHHIYRVVTFYAIGAWVIIQLANSVFPDFGMPRTGVRVVIVVLLLGFPAVLICAWLLIKPVDPGKLVRWQQRRWRLGLLLTAVVTLFVAASGAYIWHVTSQTSPQTSAQSAAAVSAGFNPPLNTIAVLPFRNLSNDPKQQYLSDGLTQELTNDLSRFAGVRVIAWQTMQGYRDSALPVSEIGKHLNVAYILMGSVMRAGDQLRASTALANTITGDQVWSSRYDQDFKDVFAMQDDISKAIISTLQLKLTGNRQLVRTATSNPAAHDAYLRGKAAFDLRTATGLREAVKQFQRAVKLDNNYADAYAQLAKVYSTLPEATSMPLKEANDKALQAAQRALQLDPDSTEAHVALANIYISEHKLDQAKTELLQALTIDPNNAAAHSSYGFLLPLEDALAQFQQAALLNPGDWGVQMNLAVTYAELGHTSKALEAYQAARNISPGNIDAPLEIAFLYYSQGKPEEAVNALRGIPVSSKADARILDASRLSYQALLDPSLKKEALSTFNKLAAGENSAFGHYYLATSYIVLGENDLAIREITRFCGSAPDTCNDIAVDPHYVSLHAIPAFQHLVTRYGLKRS